MPHSRPYAVYCDGSCIGNPGPAGWGAVIIAPDGKKSCASGSLGGATNQIAELAAAIHALALIPEGSEVVLHSDSRYLVDGLSKWLDNWLRRHWRSTAGTEVANIALWKRLDGLRRRYSIRAVWVKGHDGHPENEEADRLARTAALRSRAA